MLQIPQTPIKRTKSGTNGHFESLGRLFRPQRICGAQNHSLLGIPIHLRKHLWIYASDFRQLLVIAQPS